MPYRFAFDLGTSSIGWAVYETNANRQNRADGSQKPVGLADLGVRLFSDGRDPKTGETLGAERRKPREARRRRDRTIQRRAYLLTLLTEADLLPDAGVDRDKLVAQNPYVLRAQAAQGRVAVHELGRAIWHLHQRRGFKSNRKADKPDEDTGKIATGGERLKAFLDKQNFETLGQFLAERQMHPDPQQRQSVRIRLRGKGAQAHYDFYPQRSMIEAEFDHLWAEQARHHPVLTEELREKVRSALFFQRPLQSVKPGRCSFFPENDKRLARSQELAQEFIIYQVLNNMRVGREQRAMTLEERDKLAGPLLQGKKLTWRKVRTLLHLSGTDEISHERDSMGDLPHNPIPARFIGTARKPGPFPDGWLALPAETRNAIVTRLEDAETEEEVVDWAMVTLGLDPELAQRLSKVRLPNGHINIGERATRAILTELKKDVVPYNRAAELAGLNHSDREDGTFYDRLPPYNQVDSMQRHIGYGTGNPKDPPDKRYGRIANPTVHVALNQLRRVINALIDRYGKPEEIVVEIARDLQKSKGQKEEDAKRNASNRKANDTRRADMVDGGYIQDGERGIYQKLLRMRLWEELGPPQDRCCPYTGERLSLQRLLSDEVEIEHILPFSKTLDDSPANKTVSLLKANRLKRSLEPAKAADLYPDVFDWDGMPDRVCNLPQNKRWRFEHGAMEKFNAQKGMMDRQLHATQYLSRLAREYVSKLFPLEDEQGRRRTHVWVVTGKLTSLLRHKWGLNLGDHNQKNRDDHRHHAVDAAVIGVIDRGLLQSISTIAAREEEQGVDRLLADLEEPYEGFSDQVMERARAVMASHRPNHGRIDPADSSRTAGKLHEETYYGIVRDLPENREALDIGNVVRRKPVEELTPKEVGQVRDPKIRCQLQAVLAQVEAEVNGDKKAIKKALPVAMKAWSEEAKIYRVRVLKREGGIQPIRDRRTGAPYKYVVPAENAWLDIIELADGRWKGLATDSFSAHTTGGTDWQAQYPDSKFIMRVRKDDTLQLFDPDGENVVKRVVRLGIVANTLYLAPVNEGGDFDKRHKDESDPFRWDYANIGKLKERKARRVRFTPMGRMKTVPYGRA